MKCGKSKTHYNSTTYYLQTHLQLKLYFGHCEDYFIKYLHESNYENRAIKHIVGSKTHVSYPITNLGNLRLLDYRKHAKYGINCIRFYTICISGLQDFHCINLTTESVHCQQT